MSRNTPTTATYAWTLLALLALLAATVGAAFVDVGRVLPGRAWPAIIAVTIAVAKGLLIVLFFMHVRSSSKKIAVFAAAGFVWLAIMLTLTMSDYLTRNHPLGLNPKGEPRLLPAPGDTKR